MFFFLPFGLFSSIANAIANAFKWIFDKVLTPILKLVIMNVVVPVVELVLKALYDILQPVLLLLLQILLMLLDVVEQAFNIFAGTAPILIKESTAANFDNARNEYLMNVIFGQNTVSSAFWYVTLIAFILTMAFTVVSVARSTMDLEGKRPVGKVLGSTGKAMLSFLLVPFVVICTINLTSMVLIKSGEAISLSTHVPETTIGTHLFLTLCSESFIDPGDAKTIKEKYYSGEYKYNDKFQIIERQFNVKTIKYFSGYIVCLALALMMIIASFLFIVRIFEVVILYIVSPFFVASMPLDEGARFKSWRDLFIAKLVSGFGMVYAMKIYIMLIPILLGSDVQFFPDVYKNTVMQLIFLVGGSYAVVKSNALIMQAVNPQVAMTEAAGAGVAMGAAMMMGGRALNMGKSAAGGIASGIKTGASKGLDGAASFAKLGMQAGTAGLRGETMSMNQVSSALPQSWSSTQKMQRTYSWGKNAAQTIGDYRKAKTDATQRKAARSSLPGSSATPAGGAKWSSATPSGRGPVIGSHRMPSVPSTPPKPPKPPGSQ